MKELINSASDPIISFPLLLILFFWGLKNYHLLGSKKFAITSLIASIPITVWFLNDPNFFSIISLPDNIPIVILFYSVAFFTWLAFHKASVNDVRIDQGLPPIEGEESNREKVWVWPNLVYTELKILSRSVITLIDLLKWFF